MRRFLLAAVALVILAQALSARASAAPAASVRADYLRRESAAEREDYNRFSIAWDTGNLFFNPRAGIESRNVDWQVRSYWVGNDIRISNDFKVHLRLNHLEYGDWKTAINHFNVYVSYQIWYLRLAGGCGWAALIFDERYYRDPTNFGSQSPESRFIYEVSLRPPIWKGKLDLDLGLKNYDDFEYHGFDDTGYHIEPIFHLTENTDATFFYERRYASAFISVPTLTRTTWMVSIEHRF